MANPQPKPYFMYSIELFEALCTVCIGGREMQVFNAVVRQTYGYHRTTAKISTKTFKKLTGLNKQMIYKARKKLIELNMIIAGNHKDIKLLEYEKEDCRSLVYSVQKNYEEWGNFNMSQVVSKNGDHMSQVVSKNGDHMSQVVSKNGDHVVSKNGDHVVSKNGDHVARNVAPVKAQRAPKDIIKDIYKNIYIYIDFFQKEYKKKYKCPLVINSWEKEFMNTVSAQFSKEKLLELWQRFLSRDDEDTREYGHTIFIFSKKINLLAAQPSPEEEKERIRQLATKLGVEI